VSMGDGDPSGSRYYYWADACGYRSVKLFAEVIADIDPKMGAEMVQPYREAGVTWWLEGIWGSDIRKSKERIRSGPPWA